MSQPTVFGVMRQVVSALGREDGAMVVRKPRTSDAIGRSLRLLYGEPRLPDDMLRLLNRMDRLS